jgi:hypothetical protein
MRKLVALISALGLAASVAFFIASFFGATMTMAKPEILLHLGIFALFVPTVVIERSAIRRNTFFWTDFARSRPDWVMTGIKLLSLFFVVVFVLLLILTHAASPEIQNGDYVLDSHGKIVGLLTRAEYLFLKGWELRFIASAWMFAYFVLTTYWWFPMNKRQSA